METGHVKQVAAFEKLLGFCNAHGTLFNPSKSAIQLNALNALLYNSQQSLAQLRNAQTELDNTLNARRESFDALPKFMTRIVNTLAATEATPATVRDAYTLINKIRPQKKSRDPVPSSEPKVLRSNSQLDYDSKTAHFTALVNVVSLEPSYIPNEEDLKVSSLKAHVNFLNALNTNAIAAQVKVSNLRAARNLFLYNKGIHGSAQSVKRYVKGVFGYQSVPYQQIRGIKFENRKIK